MQTKLLCEVAWDDLATRIPVLHEQGVSGVCVRGMPQDISLGDLSELLREAPFPCLVEMPDGASEAVLDDLEYWPIRLSLLVWGGPERIEAWAGKVAVIPSEPSVSQRNDKAVNTSGHEGEEDPRLPRIVAGIRARHKEVPYAMNTSGELSGFRFYSPSTASCEGYEIVFPGSDEELLSHEERMEKYDLRRWLSRFVHALKGMAPVFLLHSETAEGREGKGLDIEMSAYCRERTGAGVIASGGLATVRHVLNYERYGKGMAVLFPTHVYDGSFTMHDIRAFVDGELADSNRSSSLAAGVYGSGRLAGQQGGHWQQESAPGSGMPGKPRG